MRMLILRIGALVATLVAGSAAAQTGMVATGSAPGVASVAGTVAITGSITAIDAQTRRVTLKGEGGNEVVITAGPEVHNFEQLTVGDAVTIEVMKALTLELKKGSTAVVSRTDDVAAAQAAQGAQPGAVAGLQVTVIAEVTAVDPENQLVTLKGPEHSIDLPIADPAQFALISVGDRVEATYVEAAAVSVTHAAKQE
jgi:Cu/Ag efflux protein CusF